jgi:hypothetical protein
MPFSISLLYSSAWPVKTFGGCLDGLDLVAFVIGAGDRLARGHQLIDLHLQLLEGEAGEHLGHPRVADHVVDFAQAVVVAEQAFLVLGGVLERHQLQRRVELVAGQQALVFHERQQGSSRS